MKQILYFVKSKWASLVGIGTRSDLGEIQDSSLTRGFGRIFVVVVKGRDLNLLFFKKQKLYFVKLGDQPTMNKGNKMKLLYLVQEQPQSIQKCPTFHPAETMQNQHPTLAPIHKLLQFLWPTHHTLQTSVKSNIFSLKTPWDRIQSLIHIPIFL